MNSSKVFITTKFYMAEINLISTLIGHQDRVWSVAWNPTGTILASCGGDKTIRLWAEEGIA